MITRHQLAFYLQDLLACGLYQDYAPNGLQVEGRNDIQRICTAVTASQDAIAQAIEWNADALLVHHGYFWKGEEPVITGMKRQRIQKLLINDINLFAYHLPLDCHHELGNNACLSKLFLADNVKQHQVGNTPDLMWTGELPESYTVPQLKQFLSDALGREPLMIEGGSEIIKRIAWCSGGAQDYITVAAQLGVDAYISGEVSERTFYQAKELGITYYSCGHHATERYGIQALGNHLSHHFGFDHQFIDSANPI